MIRLRAGISFALAKATDGGHCWLPTEDLSRTAVDLKRAHIKPSLVAPCTPAILLVPAIRPTPAFRPLETLPA
jgi:hypothetical protein